jgi:hypothetical protein
MITLRILHCMEFYFSFYSFNMQHNIWHSLRNESYYLSQISLEKIANDPCVMLQKRVLK